jgi:hypothetical protein
MPRYPNLIRALSAIALAAGSLANTPVIAQTGDPGATPADPPLIVIEDRALRERTRDRDLTLSEALELQDATGSTILTLPIDTTIGRERQETRFAAENQPIRNRTDLQRVTLQEATTLTDRRTGDAIELPAGAILRVKLDQRFDAAGNVVRDRIDIKAVKPDGTRIRIRDRSPEIEVVDRENEDGDMARDNHRQRGRDVQKPEDNGGRVARSERSDRSGRDRGDRPERSGRDDRPERGSRGGGSSGPG